MQPPPEQVSSAPDEAIDESAPIAPASLETMHRQDRRRGLRRVLLGIAALLGSLGLVAVVLVWSSGGDTDVVATRPPADEFPVRANLDFTPRVGDCLDIKANGEVEERACDRPHDAEMYATAAYRGDASGYPGRGAIEDFADEACVAALVGYVGADLVSSGLDFAFFFPDSGAWTEGDRTVECVALDLAGDKLGASVRGSGGIEHPGFLPPGSRAVGHCVDVEAIEHQFPLAPTVPCDGPHDYEVFAAVQNPAPYGEPWPGQSALLEAATACEAEPFETYVGIAYETSSLEAAWIIPDALRWRFGDRATLCLLMSGSGEPLVASMQGSGSRTSLVGGP